MDEAALDLLVKLYKEYAVVVVIEGRPRRRFFGSDVVNASGLSAAARESTEADAYRLVMGPLEDSGAVALADVRGRGTIAGEMFYEITLTGEAILREAGRIT